MTDLTPAQAARAAGFLRDREGGTSRVVPSPEGTTVVRVAWLSRGIRRHGASTTEETVKWVSWAGEEYLGASTTKRDAIAIAVEWGAEDVYDESLPLDYGSEAQGI